MDASTEKILRRHLQIYPGMEAEDCIKLLYQKELGGRHLLQDLESFSLSLKQELSLPGLFTASPCGTEPVSHELCRVYLSALEEGPTAETLAKMCVLSGETTGSEDAFHSDVQDLKEYIIAGKLPLPLEQAAAVDKYLSAQPLTQPHHSQRYRALYQPHYRLVRRDMAFYLPVFAAIDRALSQRSHILVGIDGMCASGKSRLADLLVQVYNCGVVRADDFFLQPHQRTPDRLNQAGGNIDYERLAPVAAMANEDRAFSYRAYNCQTGELETERMVPTGRLTVLEGVYGLHPKVDAPCQLRVFLGVDAAVQRRRIEERSGPELAQRFQREWIPMESAYFSEFGIRQGCDIVLDTSRLGEA